ncbi:hypothetical protein [Pseudobacillus wudalianchiensis]|uniref:Uncharacterized protein n=1 Tax=Pseudobacillus wudalianchiensis TaxID=1743143 RepID=A0A1B9B947_9BACI|nr:hypothetical protein [Bacillus wudalianchiensis]OCA92615.1 hypothetical protein A8F95_02660 [Bacillus wudalianchiensis]
MKKKLIFFLLGTILLLTSLPLSTKMVMELIHNQKMNREYKVTNVNEGSPPTSSAFRFKGHIVEIKETLKNEDGYVDPWSNKIRMADLSLELDGAKIDTLRDYPIKVEEKGLNRYYGEIAYLLLEDKKSSKTQFIVLLKKTREFKKEMPNGYIVGGAPTEKLKYTLYSLDEEGNLNTKSFSFTERNGLQTKLLNDSFMVPYSIGYYTDAWEVYPSIFFPFIFPFVTLVVGFVLIVVFFPIRKVKK